MVVLIGLAIWFLATISQVLIIVFVALVLAAAIDPWITRLERMGMARGWAMTIIFARLWARTGPSAAATGIALMPLMIVRRLIPEVFCMARVPGCSGGMP